MHRIRSRPSYGEVGKVWGQIFDTRSVRWGRMILFVWDIVLSLGLGPQAMPFVNRAWACFPPKAPLYSVASWFGFSQGAYCPIETMAVPGPLVKISPDGDHQIDKPSRLWDYIQGNVYSSYSIPCLFSHAVWNIRSTMARAVGANICQMLDYPMDGR